MDGQTRARIRSWYDHFHVKNTLKFASFGMVHFAFRKEPHRTWYHTSTAFTVLLAGNSASFVYNKEPAGMKHWPLSF
jgi:hypothetical protein